MNIFRLLFSFSGRINRARYWLGWGIAYAYILGATALGSFFPPNGTISVILGFGALCTGVSLMATIWKRLHDLSLSGWWTQLPILLVAPALIFFSDDISYFLGVSFIYLGIAGVAVIWLGCAKGVSGPNRYGPDPLAAKTYSLQI